MRLYIFLSSFLLLTISSSIFAETSLWKVSKEGQYLYLGGTVHMLSAGDLPFPEAFEQAYEDAAAVVLETDMAKLQDPATQFQLMALLSYEDGRFLNQQISARLYADLNKYLQERGLIPNMFLTMKPAGVMLTMMAVEFQRLGISQDGADTVYFKRAINDGKPVSGLESIQTHLSFIANLGEGNEEQFLRQSLDDVKKTEVLMAQIVKDWKQGNLKGLEKTVVDDMRRNYPKVYQSLLVERNLNWLPQIKRMLTTDEVELVLVGAAHLIGPDGILKVLNTQGYEIEQL